MPSYGGSGAFLSGQFASVSGDSLNAMDHLKEALAADPQNISVMSELQLLYVLDGQIEEAADLSKRMAALPDHPPLSDIVQSLWELKQKNISASQKILKKAREQNKNTLWLSIMSEWVELAAGNIKQPLSIEALLPAEQKPSPYIYYHLALLNDMAGFNMAARENYKNALPDPATAPLRALLAYTAFLERMNEGKKRAEIIAAFKKAHPETDLNSLFAANKQRSFMSEPADGLAELFFTLGSIFSNGDAPRDAQAYLRLALFLRPDLEEAQLLLADTLSTQEREAEAAKIYASIPQTSPFYRRALLRQAFLLNKTGKSDEALALLDTLILQDASGKEITALITKADILRMQGKFADAINFYSQAIGRLDNFKAFHWPLFYARGACLERQGKWDLAEADFNKALELAPDQPDVVNYLAYSWLLRGEHLQQARDMLEAAASSRPNDARIADSYGWSLYLNGDFSGAVAQLEQAIELAPADALLNDHLGDAYYRIGRKQEAGFQWQKASDYTDNEAAKQTLAKKLKNGLSPLPETAAAQH